MIQSEPSDTLDLSAESEADRPAVPAWLMDAVRLILDEPALRTGLAPAAERAVYIYPH